MALDPALILQGQTPNMAEAFQKGAANQAALNTQNAQLPGIQAESQVKQAAAPYQIQGAQLDSLMKKNQLGLQLLSTATDERSYQAAKAAGAKYGLDTSTMPENYDPKAIQQMQMGGLQIKDRLDMMYKNADLGIKQQQLGLDQQKAGRENAQAYTKNPSMPQMGGTLGSPNPPAPQPSGPLTQPDDQGSVTMPQKAPVAIDDPSQNVVPVVAPPGGKIDTPQPTNQGDAMLQKQPGAQQFAQDLPQTTGLANKGVIPDDVLKQSAETDSKREQAATNNNMVADNALHMLDTLEPNIKNFKTGSFGEERGAAAKLGSTIGIKGLDKSATAAGNIDKNTMGLITELNKFEYMPGMRGSDMALGIIKASKPGNDQLPEVNQNIIGELRGKLWGYKLSDQVIKQYKENSPLKISDAQGEQLSQSLMKLYPLTSVDPDTGKVTFNANNALKIQQITPDAVKNPQKYIQASQQAKGDVTSATPTISGPSDPAFADLKPGNKFIDKDTGKTMVKH